MLMVAIVKYTKDCLGCVGWRTYSTLVSDNGDIRSSLARRLLLFFFLPINSSVAHSLGLIQFQSGWLMPFACIYNEAHDIEVSASTGNCTRETLSYNVGYRQACCWGLTGGNNRVFINIMLVKLVQD